jgi:hypothetical protein
LRSERAPGRGPGAVRPGWPSVVGLLVHWREESLTDPFRRVPTKPRAVVSGVAVVHTAKDSRVTHFPHKIIRRVELVDRVEEPRHAAIDDEVH